MNKTLVPAMLLLLADVIVLVTSTDSVQVVSFRKSRKTQNGPVMCAMDPANTTMSSSSLQDCSRTCAHDDTCSSFNIKDSHTCDIYNYKVKLIAPVSSCMNFQVALEIAPVFFSLSSFAHVLS